ncbi:DUF1427 family protein [Parasedimentitalea marina]|uniref:DUF1427 family protein n=1 Tax=Parasedimentitalea marina TaxID=2483033 RepID=A0A3T0N773_9RHOB|nr:DUF1427 family protein [Parasedimentitalea marina]AZV79903.1 DUF1427 family protein [Parasedimentitalea marina]
MTWLPYFLSLGVGLGIGVIYGLISVRSPAPPIIALLGLFGMLAGETVVHWLRGHSQPLAQAMHLKSFAATKNQPPDHSNKT